MHMGPFQLFYRPLMLCETNLPTHHVHAAAGGIEEDIRETTLPKVEGALL